MCEFKKEKCGNCVASTIVKKSKLSKRTVCVVLIKNHDNW